MSCSERPGMPWEGRAEVLLGSFPPLSRVFFTSLQRLVPVSLGCGSGPEHGLAWRSTVRERALPRSLRHPRQQTSAVWKPAKRERRSSRRCLFSAL